MLAPSEQAPNPAPSFVDWEGLYLGPVHKVDHTLRFAAVLVPHPGVRDLLAWGNVWTSRNKRGRWQGVDFCSLVPQPIRDEWASNGWTDIFLTPN